MAENPTEATPRKARKTDEKNQRLAGALRRNLALRKAQKRARGAGGDPADGPAPAPAGPPEE